MFRLALFLLAFVSVQFAIAFAPVPKELRKGFPDVKTASNEDLRHWSADKKRWFSLIAELGEKIVLDHEIREAIETDGEYLGVRVSEVNRYWILKQAREELGGRKMEVDPGD